MRAICALLALAFLVVCAQGATHITQITGNDLSALSSDTSGCAPRTVYFFSGTTTVAAFTDDSMFASVTAVDFSVEIDVTRGPDPSLGSGFAINTDAPTISTRDTTAACDVAAQSFSMTDASLYVPNGANSINLSGNSLTILLGLPTDAFITLTITGSLTGGGGDPHIYSPHIHAQGLELAGLLEAHHLATRDQLVHAALALIESRQVRLTAMMRQVHLNDKVYFADLTVQAAEGDEAVTLTTYHADGDWNLGVRMGDRMVDVCTRQQGTGFAFSLGSGAVNVTVECGAAGEAFEANGFLSQAFGFHAKYAQARVLIVTEELEAEVFYVQELFRDGVWAGPGSGYFDVHVYPVNGGKYGGLFGNDEADAAVRAAQDVWSEDPAAASAHFVASHLSMA